MVTQAVKADQSIGLPKTNDVREIIVHSRTIEILEWWKNIAPFKEENDLVFAGRNGSQPINRAIVSREFSKALDRAKIKTLFNPEVELVKKDGWPEWNQYALYIRYAIFRNSSTSDRKENPSIIECSR